MRADARWIMASQRHPFATSPWPARVRDFRRRLFVAEPGRFRVIVLTVRVLRSVPARFADVHGCESAALTRLCGRATRLCRATSHIVGMRGHTTSTPSSARLRCASSSARGPTASRWVPRCASRLRGNVQHCRESCDFPDANVAAYARAACARRVKWVCQTLYSR